MLLFLCEHEHIGRFSNLHECTFKNAYFEEHLLTTASEVRIFKKRMSTKLSWIIYLESKTAIYTEAYPELSKSSRMEIFGKIVNGWMICLPILEKYSTENFFCAVKFLRKWKALCSKAERKLNFLPKGNNDKKLKSKPIFLSSFKVFRIPWRNSSNNWLENRKTFALKLQKTLMTLECTSYGLSFVMKGSISSGSQSIKIT